MKLLELAAAIAALAHAGAKDHAGAPYLLHPVRVMMAVESDDAKIVATLHDVVEDSAVSVESLRAFLPAHLCDAIAAISKLPGESRERYYARVLMNPLALEVKLADIADNVARLDRLADSVMREKLKAKYEKALSILLK